MPPYFPARLCLPVSAGEENAPLLTEPEQTPNAVLQSASPEATEVATDGERFMAWLRKSIESDALEANEREARCTSWPVLSSWCRRPSFLNSLLLSRKITSTKTGCRKALRRWACIIHEMVRGYTITINMIRRIKAVVLPVCRDICYGSKLFSKKEAVLRTAYGFRHGGSNYRVYEIKRSQCLITYHLMND